MDREFKLDARCPACGASELTLRSLAEDLPYFGESLISTVACGACGLRHTSTMVLRQAAPRRDTLRFRAPRDLDARVVRSDSCTWRIPELGFTAEPSNGSEAFVTNLEGVLERVRDVLVRARLIVSDGAQKERAEALLVQLQRIRDGGEEATLVLEDPFGNSRIDSDRAVAEPIPADAAAALPTGRTLLDAADLVREGA